MSESQSKTQTQTNASSDHPVTNAVTGLRKLVYIFLAVVFFVLGMIGAVLPGIPTTPFLLLMSYFLIRVSPALNQKVLAWPLVGEPIRDWQEKGGVRPHVKITAYSMVTLLVGLSIAFSRLTWPFKSAIFLAAIAGVYVVYRLPTLSDESND